MALTPVLIRDVSEDEILSRIVPLLPVSPQATVKSGDDCAVLEVNQVAVSTDMLVEGVHFRRDWSTGADVGWRAAMQNIADAVAMGARPSTLVVSMELPGDLPLAWVEDCARGMAQATRSCGCGIDGGDLVGGKAVVLGVTVLGDMEGRAPRLRSGARPGEAIIHAGNIGHAATGYELLRRGFTPSRSVRQPRSRCNVARNYVKSAHDVFMENFLRPWPPVSAVLNAVRAGSLGALMDVSDGLLRDARRMAKASHMWLDIDTLKLEENFRAVMVVAPQLGMHDCLDWAYRTVLGGGEDHGFLATLRRHEEKAWGLHTPLLPQGFKRIGTVRDKWEGGRVTLDGKDIPAYLGNSGWDHFSR